MSLIKQIEGIQVQVIKCDHLAYSPPSPRLDHEILEQPLNSSYFFNCFKLCINIIQVKHIILPFSLFIPVHRIIPKYIIVDVNAYSVLFFLLPFPPTHTFYNCQTISAMLVTALDLTTSPSSFQGHDNQVNILCAGGKDLKTYFIT